MLRSSNNTKKPRVNGCRYIKSRRIIWQKSVRLDRYFSFRVRLLIKRINPYDKFAEKPERFYDKNRYVTRRVRLIDISVWKTVRSRFYRDNINT